VTSSFRIATNFATPNNRKKQAKIMGDDEKIKDII
jgi:hypothetical protein